VEEQILWTSFDNSDIYEFITGEPDNLPEFQFNWIEPCQLTVHLPPGVIFAHPKDFQAPQDQNKPPTQPAVQPAPPAQPAVQQQHLPAPDLIAGPSGLHQPAHQHDLQPHLNYKELHTGIKQRCRKV